jgi:hypothetical protein
MAEMEDTITFSTLTQLADDSGIDGSFLKELIRCTASEFGTDYVETPMPVEVAGGWCGYSGRKPSDNLARYKF